MPLLIKFVVLIFLAIQTLFTILDLGILYRRSGAPSVRSALARYGKSIGFFCIFWLLFFLVQTGGLVLLPTFDRMASAMAAIVRADLSQPIDITPGIIVSVLLLNVWTFTLISAFDYLTHRFVLHHRLGWKFHEYHHLPREIFNGMPGISVRPFVFFATLLTYVGVAPVLLLTLRFVAQGPAAAAFLRTLPLLIAGLTLILSVGHSLFLRRFGTLHTGLRRIGVTSPQEHLFHHSRTRHCNYGNFSTIWDRVFKSYFDPKLADTELERLGVPYPADFLSTLTFGIGRLPEEYVKRIGADRYFETFSDSHAVPPRARPPGP